MVEPLVVSPSGVDAIALGDSAAFEHNGVLVQYEGIGAGEVGRSLAFVRDPRFVGTGFFAGEAPDGLTTVYGDPISADVFVYWRDPDDPMAQEVLVGATKSAPDGTWCITGLNYNLRYVVRARASGRDDVTVVSVQPSRSDVIAYVDHLEPTEEFDGLTGYVLLDSGLPPFTCQVIQPLPYGLSARVDGRKLLIEGVSSDAGLWESMVRVTASNGAWADVPVQVRIAWTPASLSVAPKIWLDWDSQLDAAAMSWHNAGSAGGAFSQANAAARPSVVIGPGGRRVLAFDGVDSLSGSSVAALKDVMRGVTKGWVIWVANKSSPAGTILFFSTNNAIQARVAALEGSASASYTAHLGLRRLDGGAYVGVNEPVDASISAGWRISYASFDWSDRKATVITNAGDAHVATNIGTSAGSISNTSSASVTIAVDGNGGNRFAGELACIICGSGDLPTPPEIDKLFGWAAHRLSLADLLPADHPYKEAAP